MWPCNETVAAHFFFLEQAHAHVVQSKIQTDVASHMKLLRLTFEEEAVDPSSGYSSLRAHTLVA